MVNLLRCNYETRLAVPLICCFLSLFGALALDLMHINRLMRGRANASQFKSFLSSYKHGNHSVTDILTNFTKQHTLFFSLLSFLNLSVTVITCFLHTVFLGNFLKLFCLIVDSTVNLMERTDSSAWKQQKKGAFYT